jgi:hypothetical protein
MVSRFPVCGAAASCIIYLSRERTHHANDFLPLLRRREHSELDRDAHNRRPDDAPKLDSLLDDPVSLDAAPSYARDITLSYDRNAAEAK